MSLRPYKPFSYLGERFFCVSGDIGAEMNKQQEHIADTLFVGAFFIGIIGADLMKKGCLKNFFKISVTFLTSAGVYR